MQDIEFVASRKGPMVAAGLGLFGGAACSFIATAGPGSASGELLILAGVLGLMGAAGALLLLLPAQRIVLGRDTVRYGRKVIPLEDLIVGDIELMPAGNSTVHGFELQWLDDRDAIRTAVVTANYFPNLRAVHMAVSAAAGGHATL